MVRMGCRALLLALLLAVAPLAMAQDRPGDGRSSVCVAGQAALQKTADQAVLDVGMVSEAATAAEAAGQNAQLTARVMAALKAGMADDDRLETIGYDLSAQNKWDETAKVSRVVGYRAAHTLRLTTADPQRLGQLLDVAVASGANDVNGPLWRLADHSAAQIEAQALAVDNARDQAQALAKAAGMRLGRLVSADATGGGAPQRDMRLAMAAPHAAAPTQLTPGRITVEATVTCVFALLP